MKNTWTDREVEPRCTTDREWATDGTFSEADSDDREGIPDGWDF